jgi:hypothetical protein
MEATIYRAETPYTNGQFDSAVAIMTENRNMREVEGSFIVIGAADVAMHQTLATPGLSLNRLKEESIGGLLTDPLSGG